MRLQRVVIPATVVAAAVALAAVATCTSPRRPQSGALAAAQCSRCHGSADNAAPPRTAGGAEAPSDLGVGAHQTHVRAGPLRGPVPCQECHVVPAREDDPGHVDKDHGDVAFGPLATARGATPVWSRGAATCSGVYCHGATLAGGTHTAPRWTQVDGSQVACGSCHAAPPPPQSGHPPVAGGREACAACHPDTVNGDGTINVASGRHVNGRVDLGALGCVSCHGDRSNGNAAPPRGTRGETATTARAVGAHQQHLSDGPLRQALACAECHAVPSDTSHVNGSVDLTWGPLARAGGAVPVWDGARCSGVYCHGGTLNAGGSNTSPTWTKVGAGEVACGACHGIPPPPSTGHPAVPGGATACGLCHPGVTASGAIDVAAGKHVNGVVDVKDLSCTSCHGDAGRAVNAPAPPHGTHGETATTALAVGAHAQHLQGGRLRAGLSCADCHPVPTSTTHTDGKVDLAFGPLARAGGANPSWDRASATCSGVYCHGATLHAGGAATAPVWTRVDGSQIACGTCHGAPPPPSTGHPAVGGELTVCSGCHADTVKPDGTIDVAAGKHMNGTVDVAGVGCTSCHGNATTGSPAPPRGTHGETATTSLAVGAHQSHLQNTAVRAALGCDACHVLPSSTAHSNGRVDIAFGALATAGGASPAWDRSSATCSGVYCHGATLPGGATTSPVWTRVDGTQAACTSCHGFPPPPSSGHPVVSGGAPACARCHPGTVKPDGTIDVAGGRHVNGAVDVIALSCTSCHGDPARPVNAPAPPAGTRGDAATTSRAVGAHQQHLQGGPLREGLACGECHAVPTSTAHANGVAEVTFGPLATARGAAARWDGTTCSTYCHGATLAGGTLTAPTWTRVDGTQAACGACHGIPPPPSSGHPAVPSDVTVCAGCHPGTVDASGRIVVNGGLHVNGQVDVANLSCTSCHGDPARPANAAAPPRSTKGETATSARAVGAHAQHLSDSPLRAAVACSECHVVPASTSHTNGVVELAFGALARTGGAAPAWNGTSCAATYCHGGFRNGNAANAPVWTRVDGSQAACGTCHGIPPGGTHPQGVTQCGSCHDGYSQASVNRALHMNGSIDVKALGCASCHGDPSRARNPAAPPSGTHGEAATSARAVGAHQSHVQASALRDAVNCSECHPVPTSTFHSNGVVEIAFGPLARAGGAAPVWNGGSCAATYCHGAFRNGNGTNSPVWTRVDGSQAACGSCHGIPPGGTHPQGVTQCGSCHPGYTPTSVAVATHVNGTVDVNLTCTSCHGTPGGNAAPPSGTHGEAATSARAVGAHQSHVTGGNLAAAIDCSGCHPKPTSTSHSNGTVDMAFGALANQGTAASWTGTTCANYCHGATLQGGANPNPTWTRADGSQAACGACHGVPPPTGQHGREEHRQAGCGACHGGYGAASVNASAHVNGRVDLGGSKIQSYDAATKSCSPACHEQKRWIGGS
jgi:predicted CxxxxCH...CXXCH cytochrome family protein